MMTEDQIAEAKRLVKEYVPHKELEGRLCVEDKEGIVHTIIREKI